MSNKRINRIKEHKRFDTIDALLIKSPQNILYVLGFNIESETTLLMLNEERIDTNNNIIAFISALEYDEATEQIERNKDLRDDVEIVKIRRANENLVEKRIKKLHIRKLGFEDEFINVKLFKQMKNKLKNAELIGASEIVLNARLTKTKEEIERIQRAAELGIIGFNSIYENIKKGMTENELAAIAEFEMKKAGADSIAFNTIVASGKRSAFPHGKTSDKKIENGDTIIVDIGATYNGYCSDMTRTFLFNGKDSKSYSDKAKLIDLVNRSQEMVLNEVKAGKNASELDTLVREYFKKESKEWGDRFIHSLGHGVGIDVHEKPYLSASSEDVLEEGMCITIEPGLYIPGLGGARTEDLLIVKENGFENLTPLKKYTY